MAAQAANAWANAWSTASLLEQQLGRIEHKAEQGDKIANFVRRFRESLDEKDLRNVTLDQVLELLCKPRDHDEPGRSVGLDLAEAFDKKLTDKTVLDDMAVRIDLGGEDDDIDIVQVLAHSQRRWPVPLHSLQMPIVMPTRDFLPVARHATQEVVLWPWHLGHNVFVGISPPVLGSGNAVGLVADNLISR
jgi:hypothetical protein